MALPRNRKNRPGRSTASEVVSKTPLGGARTSQVVSTYGVGAMIAIGDQSYIVSGLDTWRTGDQPLYEPRLQNRLRVDRFFAPPFAPDPRRPLGDGVRIRMFPDLYSCPICGDLKEFNKFGATLKNPSCAGCSRKLIPSRFVVACEKGHIDDFPYWMWVHKGRPAMDGKHELRLLSDTRTASLQSVVIECSCGHSASMEGAFGRKAMESVRVRCGGRRPWLGQAGQQSDCDAVPRTLQRGASAAWFGVTRSSISIPPWSENLQKLVEKHLDLLKAVADESNAIAVIRKAVDLEDTDFSPEDLLEAFVQRQDLVDMDPLQGVPIGTLEASAPFRLEEYDPLHSGTNGYREGEDFECVPPDDVDTVSPPKGVGRTMLVKRLREVRALESFTRVEAPDAVPDRSRHAALSLEKVSWLPAVEVSGEGVFLTLERDRLVKWEKFKEPVERADKVRNRHTRQLRDKAAKRGDQGAAIQSSVSARYILVHTLAHVLINEWSLDAGYPSASLRERLYVSDDHAGLLIYTATSDSAGSLGGLIAQGGHVRLDATIESALNRIAWCSQDPPCMETEASGTDSLNLAACYACVMVPESSCETNNTFLDRALVVGSSGGADNEGYFTSPRLD